MAFPETTLPAAGTAPKDARQILDWARSRDAGGIVLGLPINMDGTEGPQAALSRRLAEQLLALGDLPVELWDERLSSFAADQVLDAAAVRRSRRRNLRDALAAQVILQSFLDARRATPPEGDSPTGDS
jgi:putative Holliday junction resolvase